MQRHRAGSAEVALQRPEVETFRRPTYSGLMTLALIVALALGTGTAVRRWWALLAPLMIACLAEAALWMGGHALDDTPIPFFVLTATLAMAIGTLLGDRILRHPR